MISVRKNYNVENFDLKKKQISSSELEGKQAASPQLAKESKL
jgi:hypothetical protein